MTPPTFTSPEPLTPGEYRAVQQLLRWCVEAKDDPVTAAETRASIARIESMLCDTLVRGVQ
jgi:hypothetical protein